MKIILLILGVVLLALGAQDAFRLLADANQSSIFSFIPGEISLYIGLDVSLVVCGAWIASKAAKMGRPSSK